MTVVSLANGVIIPLHWNDQYYESPECAECGQEIWTKTIDEMVDALENHACVSL
jgi:hypothetical protein